jgi:hypothetical protein
MATVFVGRLRQRLCLLAMAFVGRTRTAFFHVPQACEVGIASQVPRSLAGKPDMEAVASKPQEDGSGGRLFSLGTGFGRTAVHVDAPGKEAFGEK